ncbi:putative RNA-directed DNA polymerase, partial [Tanacetum coccineum]
FDFGTSKDLNHENFFDEYFENPKHPESPNDDERVSSNDDGTESLTSQEEDGDSRATSMDENTPPEGITETFLDPNLDNSDQPAETVAPRRSSRPSRISAMNNEMEALNMNKTWIITDLPPNRKAIGCKWVYKIKYKSNGEIERYKARLVAKGYSQREGIDYEETFSPVVKMVTIRCLIALAVKNKWDMYQLDVCKLVKSLYGLKQAPRKWNEKLVLTLSEHGFIKRESDHSLFIKNTNDIFVALLVYIDDIVITGNDSVEISEDALKVLRYLKGSLGKGLRYFSEIQSDPLSGKVVGFTDADWAKCLVTRKSVSEPRALLLVK